MKELLKKIENYYNQEGNCCGGSLHIVLDDFNIEDSHITYCVEHAKNKKDQDAVEIGEELLKLSLQDRFKVVMNYLHLSDEEFNKKWKEYHDEECAKCRICDTAIEEGQPFCDTCDPTHFICVVCGEAGAIKSGISQEHNQYLCGPCAVNTLTKLI